MSLTINSDLLAAVNACALVSPDTVRATPDKISAISRQVTIQLDTLVVQHFNSVQCGAAKIDGECIFT